MQIYELHLLLEIEVVSQVVSKLASSSNFMCQMMHYAESFKRIAVRASSKLQSYNHVMAKKKTIFALPQYFFPSGAQRKGQKSQASKLAVANHFWHQTTRPLGSKKWGLAQQKCLIRPN